MFRVFAKLYWSTFGALLTLAAFSAPALAHDAPDTGNGAFVLADWMLFAFLLFAGTGIFMFIVLLKRGYFRNAENNKYYVLKDIDVPDYFTDGWEEREADVKARWGE